MSYRIKNAFAYILRLMRYNGFSTQQSNLPRGNIRLNKIHIYSNFFVGISTKGILWGKKETPEANDTKTKSVDFTTSSRVKDNFIVAVSKKCAPSVVYIEIRDPTRIMPDTGQPITASNGSGFFVREDGWIMTNAHVVMSRPNCIVMVTTNDGVTYKAEVKQIDIKTDLALLKIPAQNMTVLKFGDSQEACVGEWVVALGSPLSLSHTITAGVISSVNRNAIDLGISNHNMKYIQTDAAITFGHSGGPLVNLDGEVIGINNLRITAGIAFAIPVEYAKEFLTHSIMNDPTKFDMQTINHCLGMTTLSLTEKIDEPQYLNHKDLLPSNFVHGVYIWKLIAGKAGHKSGLQIGDIITHVNGHAIHESSDIYKHIPPNGLKNVSISILRKGVQKEIKIDL